MKIKFVILIATTVFLLGACDQQRNEQINANESEEVVPKTQLEIDSEIIEKYLARNKIDANTTSTGLYYSIQEVGSGQPVADGKNVTFHTTGNLLDGTKFYSSLDDGQPLEVIVGQKMLVPGMEEGLQFFRAGGKGTLYLPSSLGYGDKGSGTQIPPNSIIVFEVEILSVE